MLVNPFSFRAVWGDPLNSLDESVVKNLELLYCLRAALSEPLSFFVRPFALDLLHRADTRGTKLPLSPEAIEQTIRRQQLSEGNGHVVESLGFPLRVYGETKSGQRIFLSTCFGARPQIGERGVPNEILMLFPEVGDVAQKLNNPAGARTILDCALSVATPLWAVFDHVKLLGRSARTRQIDLGIPQVGWLTYIRVTRDKLPPMPARSITFDADHGSAILAVDAAFDVEDSEQLDAISSVKIALEDAELMKPTPLWDH